MSVLITLFIGFSIVLISIALFKKWFNPLALYTFIWMMMIILYEIRLMNFVKLTVTTWAVIIISFLSFFLGVVTVFSARAVFRKPNNFDYQEKQLNKLFVDNGVVLKIFIIFFSLLGLFAAIQHWGVLLNKYGSVPAVLIQAGLVYRNRVEGDIQGMIPYISVGTDIAIVLSAIYLVYKNKFKIIIILPFIGLILESLAEFARAHMLMGLLEFLISFFLFKNIYKTGAKIKKGKNGIVLVLIIFVLIFATASFIKNLRDSTESFKASGSALNKFKGGLIISPAIYLYSCSHIGVLNNYLSSQDENNYFGEVTFFPFYRFISKFDVIRQPSYYQKGYFIPMWSNTGTYLRDLHADFGSTGLFSIPFCLGFLATFFWFRFYQYNRFYDFFILVYVTIIIAFSFVLMATRFANWGLSLIILMLLIPVMEKVILLRMKSKIINTIS